MCNSSANSYRAKSKGHQFCLILLLKTDLLESVVTLLPETDLSASEVDFLSKNL